MRTFQQFPNNNFPATSRELLAFKWKHCECELSFQLGSLKSISSEAVTKKCSVKKVFLKILQNSQENNCAGDSF